MRWSRLGLMQRLPHPSDGRSQVLQTTPKADGEIQKLAPLLVNVNDTLFGQLESADFQSMARGTALWFWMKPPKPAPD